MLAAKALESGRTSYEIVFNKKKKKKSQIESGKRNSERIIKPVWQAKFLKDEQKYVWEKQDELEGWGESTEHKCVPAKPPARNRFCVPNPLINSQLNLTLLLQASPPLRKTHPNQQRPWKPQPPQTKAGFQRGLWGFIGQSPF